MCIARGLAEFPRRRKRNHAIPTESPQDPKDTNSCALASSTEERLKS
jgi:hypothetical protein